MTSLICLVMRCNLADGRLVKENEPFETSPAEAAILIRGGIAKEPEAPAPIRPEPPKEEKPETVPAKIIEEPAVPLQELLQADSPEQKPGKRSRRA